jgi:hypothetical protein
MPQSNSTSKKRKLQKVELMDDLISAESTPKRNAKNTSNKKII